MKRSPHILRLLPIAAACIACPALATNGYFPHGYGIKAKGMGGVSTALAQDSLGGATNPAGMVCVRYRPCHSAASPPAARRCARRRVWA